MPHPSLILNPYSLVCKRIFNCRFMNMDSTNNKLPGNGIKPAPVATSDISLNVDSYRNLNY